MEDKKKKGLYFLCEAKYILRHKCMKSQLYKLLVDPYFDGEGDDFQ